MLMLSARKIVQRKLYLQKSLYRVRVSKMFTTQSQATKPPFRVRPLNGLYIMLSSRSLNETSLLSDEKVEQKPKDVKRELKPVVTIAGRTITMKVDALDTFFYLMAERHRIYRKRAAGLPPPWTDDPILAKNRFCNVYRVLDRGTQYVLNEIINKGPQDFKETCFRVMLYKLFNRIPTWEYLVEKLGIPTWETFDLGRYSRVLRGRLLSSPIYTGVYQIPAPKLGYPTSHMNHLRQLQMMMEDNVPRSLLRKTSMKEAFKLISSYPGMGPFLGLQLLLELNMTSQLDFSESEWVICGPGSRSYLRQIFGNDVGGIENEAIAYLHLTQNDHFARLGITDPPSLSPDRPGVSYIDLEHSLCECHKYVRLKRQLRTERTAKKEEFKPDIKREAKLEVKKELKAEVKKEMKLEVKKEMKLEVKEEVKLKVKEEMNIKTKIEDVEIIDVDALPEPDSPLSIIDVDAWSGPDSPLTIIDVDEVDDPGRYVDDETDYEVSHIVADRRSPEGKWEYRVRWTGYGPEDDIWLPEAELKGAPLVLREWRALRRDKMRTKEVFKSSRNNSKLKSRIRNFSSDRI